MTESDDYTRDANVHGPDGKMRLCASECDTCIFAPPGVRLPLRPGRLRDLIADARLRESYIVCHATMAAGSSPAVCRGFSDRFSTNPLRVFRRLGAVVEISPPSTKEARP